MPITISTLQKRINKGIAFLDKKFKRKNWVSKIDLKELNLRNGSTCMIGEVMGDYSGGRDDLKKSDEQMEQMGFYITKNMDIDYPVLTYLWKAALIKLGVNPE